MLLWPVRSAVGAHAEREERGDEIVQDYVVLGSLL